MKYFLQMFIKSIVFQEERLKLKEKRKKDQGTAPQLFDADVRFFFFFKFIFQFEIKTRYENFNVL